MLNTKPNIDILSNGFHLMLLRIKIKSFNKWKKIQSLSLSQVTNKLYHIILYNSPWSRFELTTSVVIGTDCIRSCKSNYHKITATPASPPPLFFFILHGIKHRLTETAVNIYKRTSVLRGNFYSLIDSPHVILLHWIRNATKVWRFNDNG